MGTIWAAHDEFLDRWVAVKEIAVPTGTPGSEAERVGERAMREARAIASISDPHVVTVYDLVATERLPAIVMELLDAQSIAELLTQGGPLTESQSAAVGLGVASALMAAHAAGVIHRDVKPGNVLLCRDGRIKLADFGIARSSLDVPLTATGLLLGSPAYIAPEVAAGRPADSRSDLWGLGALLFACQEGHPPFDAGDPIRTLTSVLHDPVPPAPHAGRLTALIGSLLQKDPRRRMALSHARRILASLTDDPTGQSLAHRVWGSATLPGSRSRPAGAIAGPAVESPTVIVSGNGQAFRAQRQRRAAAAGHAHPSAGLASAGGPVPRRAASPGRADRPGSAWSPAPAQASPPPPLPPPPWAGESSALLRPLPVRAAPSRLRARVLAVGLAVVLAAGGFLAGRWAVAQWWHPDPLWSSTGQAPLPPDDLPTTG